MHIHYNTNQTTLPLEISSLLPQDHLVFTIEKVVNTLEDSHFHAFYHAFGRPSYHPKMLVSALLFAYSQGIFSGRKIEKMMIENLAMQYLTGQLIVSYRTINRFRVAEGMEELIRNLFIDLNLRLKMEELVTLDCLFIDGTKIEANANKYSFVWKKATDKFSAKLQEQIQVYFQEEITPLIHQAIELDTQDPISYAMFDKEQKRGYKQSARNLANWHYDDKEDSYTHPDGWCYRFHHIKHQKTQTDFQQEIKVYYADEPESAPQKGLYMNERYQHLKTKECQALLSPKGRQIFAQRKIDVEPVFGQIKACLGYKRCNLRGKRQVRIDMGLVLMANNLLKYNKRTNQN